MERNFPTRNTHTQKARHLSEKRESGMTLNKREFTPESGTVDTYAKVTDSRSPSPLCEQGQAVEEPPMSPRGRSQTNSPSSCRASSVSRSPCTQPLKKAKTFTDLTVGQEDDMASWLEVVGILRVHHSILECRVSHPHQIVQNDAGLHDDSDCLRVVLHRSE